MIPTEPVPEDDNNVYVSLDFVDYTTLKKPDEYSYIRYPMLSNKQIYYLPQFVEAMRVLYPNNDDVYTFTSLLWNMYNPRFYRGGKQKGCFYNLNTIYQDVKKIEESSSRFMQSNYLYTDIEKYFKSNSVLRLPQIDGANTPHVFTDSWSVMQLLNIYLDSMHRGLPILDAGIAVRKLTSDSDSLKDIYRYTKEQLENPELYVTFPDPYSYPRNYEDYDPKRDNLVF